VPTWETDAQRFPTTINNGAPKPETAPVQSTVAIRVTSRSGSRELLNWARSHGKKNSDAPRDPEVHNQGWPPALALRLTVPFAFESLPTV